jgi:hypothetical protein
MIGKALFKRKEFPLSHGFSQIDKSVYGFFQRKNVATLKMHHLPDYSDDHHHTGN